MTVKVINPEPNIHIRNFKIKEEGYVNEINLGPGEEIELPYEVAKVLINVYRFLAYEELESTKAPEPVVEAPVQKAEIFPEKVVEDLEEEIDDDEPIQPEPEEPKVSEEQRKRELEEELEELKIKRAWMKPELKGRWKEVKKLLNQ